MSIALVVLNFAYLALVSGSIARRMLHLRFLLGLGSICFVLFGLLEGNFTIVAWNAVIGVMHAQQLTRLVLEQRRSQTSEKEDAIRMAHFPGLDRVEFRTLWSVGTESLLEDERFITDGARQEYVYLILDGEVAVHTGGKLATTLGPGSVVGEMSRNAGGVANADCTAAGPVELRRWEQSKLAALGGTCPAALLAFEYLVQRDLVAKVLGEFNTEEGPED